MGVSGFIYSIRRNETEPFTQVDIVVGTPGRLEDLISTGKMELSSCRFFVLDECVSLFLSTERATSVTSKILKYREKSF